MKRLMAGRVLPVAGLVLAAAVPALAQAPPIDLAPAINGAATQIYTMVQSVAGPLLLLLGALLGIAVVLRILSMVGRG